MPPELLRTNPRLQADIYEHEGNEQQTYLLLFRHAQLVLGRLTQHPDVGPTNRAALAKAEEDVKAGLAKMEVLKPRINKKYERYSRIVQDRKANVGPGAQFRSAAGVVTQQQQQQSVGNAPLQQEEHDGWFHDNAGVVEKQLAAGEHRDLAVQLAKKEIRRRAAARKASLRAGVSEQVEQERRTAGVWGNWEKEYESGMDGGESLSRQMQNVRLKVDERQKEHASPPARTSSSSSPYKYPSVHKSNPISTTPQRPSPASTTLNSISSSGPLNTPTRQQQSPRPQLPPKDQPILPPSPAPARPPKQAALTSPSTLSGPLPTYNESPDTSLNPTSFTFSNAATLENGTPLRTVFLPPDLRHRFVSIAAPNTARNLETCGILCGTLISNALFVSRLVIPEQISTSDTCETVNEGLLFDYVDSEDLMMLGWIHTHPTQTCFMSSRDLHTHGGYQAMLPESLAIVCAPSKTPDWGVFRLTDPPGLKTVLNCTQKGLFHPHEERNMYTDALRPGHVFEAKGLEWDVHDMRK